MPKIKSYQRKDVLGATYSARYKTISRHEAVSLHFSNRGSEEPRMHWTSTRQVSLYDAAGGLQLSKDMLCQMHTICAVPKSLESSRNNRNLNQSEEPSGPLFWFTPMTHRNHTPTKALSLWVIAKDPQRGVVLQSLRSTTTAVKRFLKRNWWKDRCL